MLFPTLTLLQPPWYLQASCPDVRSQYLIERTLVANTCRISKSMMEGWMGERDSGYLKKRSPNLFKNRTSIQRQCSALWAFLLRTIPACTFLFPFPLISWSFSCKEILLPPRARISGKLKDQIEHNPRCNLKWDRSWVNGYLLLFPFKLLNLFPFNLGKGKS